MHTVGIDNRFRVNEIIYLLCTRKNILVIGKSILFLNLKENG